MKDLNGTFEYNRLSFDSTDTKAVVAAYTDEDGKEYYSLMLLKETEKSLISQLSIVTRQIDGDTLSSIGEIGAAVYFDDEFAKETILDSVKRLKAGEKSKEIK